MGWQPNSIISFYAFTQNFEYFHLPTRLLIAILMNNPRGISFAYSFIPIDVKFFRRSKCFFECVSVMSQQDPNSNGDIVKDFQSTGRTGRRNAMADVLGANKDISTSDLPLQLEKLSTNGEYLCGVH